MANKNILTYNAKVTQIEKDYFSPVAILPTSGQVINSLYCFLSRIDPWTSDLDPEEPTQDTAYLKNVYKNIFIVKKIQSSDIAVVTERKDWSANTVYDYYRDDVDMFEKDINGFLKLDFYVRNQYDQVFICLWNNNGGLSTNQPYFQPGTYGTNNIYQAADGYKWKYIYTIDIGSKTKFMDSVWMPVPIIETTLNPLSTSAGCGDIEVINVVDSGSGYDPANSTITVSITGDGSGAAASVVTSNGAITDIVVTNPGTNYSFATINIVSASGAGANLIAPISPIGGHGFDAVTELGCNHVMLTATFNGSEGGYIPTNIDYRQVGILNNPLALSTYPNFANSNIYKTSTDFIVAPGFGTYVNDEVIYQGSSLETASFSAKVLSFDGATNIISLINITGTPTINSPVFGNSSATVRTLLNVITPDFINFSGRINYIQNRSGVQRSSDGIEQFKFVLGY
jgi:hypothetical protein